MPAGDSLRGSTPVREKELLSSSIQFQFTEAQRDALMADSEGSTRVVSLEKFFSVLPTINDNDITWMLDELRDRPRPLITQSNRWRGFPKAPSKSGKVENRAFAPLEPIINAIFERTRHRNPKCGSALKFCSKPDAVPKYTSRPSRSRPDSHVRFEDKDDIWEYIICTLEVKTDVSAGEVHDNLRKTLWSLYQAVRDNPRRRFAYACTIEDQGMQLWLVTRSVLLKTPTFDFVEDKEHFIRFFMALQSANEERLGFDPTMTRVADLATRQYDIVVRSSPDSPPRVFRTERILSNHLAESLFGRGSRVWAAREVVDGVLSPDVVAVKDTWIDSTRDREGDQLNAIETAALKLDEETRAILTKSLLTLVCHGDVLIPRGDGQLDVDDHMLILRGMEFPFDEPKFDLQRAAILNPNPKLPEGAAYAAPSKSADIPPVIRGPMTHYRIVYKEVVTAFFNLTSMAQIFQVFVDLCLGLAALHKTGFVHRDISITNVFVDDDGNTRIGDLEYAIHMDYDGPVHPIRTASADFTSVEVQEGTYAFLSLKKIASAVAGQVPKSRRNEDQDPSRPPVSQSSNFSAAEPEFEQPPPFTHNPVNDFESVLWMLIYVVWKRSPQIADASEELEAALYDFRKGIVGLIYKRRSETLKRGIGINKIPDGSYPPMIPGIRATVKIWGFIWTLLSDLEKTTETIAAIDHTVAEGLALEMASCFASAKKRFITKPVDLIPWKEEIKRENDRIVKAKAQAARDQEPVHVKTNAAGSKRSKCTSKASEPAASAGSGDDTPEVPPPSGQTRNLRSRGVKGKK